MCSAAGSGADRRRPPAPPLLPEPTAPPITVDHWRGLLDALVELPDGFMLAVESTGRWDPEMLQKLLHAELTRRPGLLGARRLRTRLAEHGAVWVWCDPVARDASRDGQNPPPRTPGRALRPAGGAGQDHSGLSLAGVTIICP